MTHNIEMLKERFTEYLNAMFCKYDFAKSYVDAYDCEDMYYDWKKDGEMSDNYGTWFATGCTRFVMGDEDHDYVIKFQKENDKVNYGEFEVNTYNRAVAAGYGDKFAWCAKLMDYHYEDDEYNIDIPIYVMECVECNYSTISEESYNYHYGSFCEQKGIDPDAEGSRSDYYNCDGDYCSTEAMLEFAFNLWGASLLFKKGFVKFLRQEQINDLHCGNWGYRGDMLILTDYAGYGDPEERSDIHL